MSRKLVLLTVNGHPDDEIVNVGGVMARYAAEGMRVICVTATRGEVGQIVAADLNTPENRARLGELRQQELERGLLRLGAVEHRCLDYRDSGMTGSADNLDPRSFCWASLDDATARLVRIVREVHAHVIVAPNSFGGDGHPDHIRAGEIARLAFERSGDPSAYPIQLRATQLDAWAPSKLYETVDDLGRREKLLRALRSGGIRAVVSIGLRVVRVWRPGQEGLRRRAAAAQGPVTTRVDVGAYARARYEAMAEHRSQIDPRGYRFALTPEQRQLINPTENFSLRRSRVETSLPEDDLFAGLRPEYRLT